MRLQQGGELGFRPVLVLRQALHTAHAALRQPEDAQQVDSFGIDAEGPATQIAQHVHNRQPVLVGRRKVSRIQRIAHHMTMLILTIDQRGRIVQVLPRAAAQPGCIHRGLLGVQFRPVFDQPVGQLARRQFDAHIGKKFQDLRLRHVAGEILHQRQRLDPRPELPGIARRQCRQIRPPLARRVVLLFVKQHVGGVDYHVLHQAIFVALELSVRWQLRWVEVQHFLVINLDLGQLAALLPRLRLAPLGFRRVVAAWPRCLPRRLGLISGLPCSPFR